MKEKIKIILIISVLISSTFFLFSEVTNAISGACSSHNGVNCAMGRQLNGKVYCNDGWTGSMADYEFTAKCKEIKFNCTVEEWTELIKKYQIEDIYFKMDDLIEEISKGNTLAITLYNAYQGQFDTALGIANKTCEALGADRADQQNYKRMKLEFDQKNKLEDELRQLNQKELDIKTKYIDELTKLQNIPQYICPANLIVSGDKCVCADGYTYNGSVCITYSQSCQAKYGANSYGDKQFCHCSVGYEWNSLQTICIKTEVKPIILPPAVKPVVQETNDSKEVTQKISKPMEKLIVKSEPTKEDTLFKATSTSEKISTPKEEIKKESKLRFFTQILGSIKNFFSKIFR